MKVLEMEFHPLAEQYPLMPKAELGVLIESMKADGFNDLFPIVTRDGKILDGRNRYRAAIVAGVEPQFIEYEGDDPEGFVQLANENRRHLAVEWLKKHRAERIQRHTNMHIVDGQSVRQIADATGTPKSTVADDIAEGVRNRTVEDEPLITTGKDGKKRKAAQNQPVLCSRCKRVGAVAACGDCAEAKKTARKSVTKPKTLAAKLEADAAADPEPEPTIEEKIKAKNSELESWCRDLMKFAATMPEDAWLDDMNRRGSAISKLKSCCETIRSAKCSKACPKCDGAACRHCHNTGRVTTYALQQMGAA